MRRAATDRLQLVPDGRLRISLQPGNEACVKPIRSAPDQGRHRDNSQFQRLRQKTDGFVLLEVIAVMHFLRVAEVVNPSDIDRLAA